MSMILQRQKINAIRVFVAGSKALEKERDAVISTLTHLTNKIPSDFVIRVKTYEDFERSLTDEGRQAEYNDYIFNDADYAIFILDGKVGGITLEEFNVAMKAFTKKGKPKIYVYSHLPKGLFRRFFIKLRQSKDIITIRKHLTEIGQYYIEYKDIDDLKNHVSQDFISFIRYS